MSTEGNEERPMATRPAPDHDVSNANDLLFATLLAVIVRIAFAAATGRVWEDALITIEHARNAVAGMGLTHHPGEGPTHGFTSALSVLIPLVGEAIASGAGIAVLQLASLAAVVATLVFAWRIAAIIGLTRPVTLLVLVFLAVEQNHVFYGMSGMETQVVVATVLGAFWAALDGRTVVTGIAMGLAALARPEALVLLVPFVVATLWVMSSPRVTVAAAGVGVVVIAPWVLFTSWYYGSPIPQTILAKSATYAVFPEGRAIAEWLIGQVTTHIEPTLRTFMPFLADTMVVSAPVPSLIPALVSATVFLLIGAGIVAGARDRRWWGLAGYFLALSAYRVIFLPSAYYDWYVPPMSAIGILIAARGIDAVFPAKVPRRIIAASLSMAFLLPLPWLFVMERAVQDIADGGVRAEVAGYLAENVDSSESVSSESAGYVGTSGVTLWDFPGLTSPTALEVIRSLPRGARSVSSLVAVARPDWAVLRKTEYDVLVAEWPIEAAAYQTCAVIGPGGDGIETAGLVKRSFDLEFYIIRRHPCPDR